jgi:hypothetical protein
MKMILLVLFSALFLLPLQANELDQYTAVVGSNGLQTCSDEVFIRRIYISLTGRLPQSEKAVQFLETTNLKKRELLIDELLNSEEYVRYITMRWGDILRIKSEFPSNLWPNGVQAYNRWLYEGIATNMPYNQFVSELLLSKGSNFRSPAVNFYRAFLKRTPENIYQNISLLFLGSRKPLDDGKDCFTQLRYKKTKEWKEEIVYIDIHGKSSDSSMKMFDNKEIKLSDKEDFRIPFVKWLTGKENERFAGVMVNRLWYWMIGKGIVNEPDDWGDHNLPTNPALLKFMTNHFINSGYDMKAMLKLILNSNAFQSDIAPRGNYIPQRMQGEVLVDALADLTGVSDAYNSRVPEPFTFYPAGTRSRDLGDATVSSSDLELFGRVSRDVSLESQRSNKITSRQLLYLSNSVELEAKIRKSERLNEICTQNIDLENICKAISLMTLSRYPKPEELALFKTYGAESKLKLRDLASAILWTYINSTEFLYNH